MKCLDGNVVNVNIEKRNMMYRGLEVSDNGGELEAICLY